ncbi:MAG TPA: tail fiber domain-containing protein, partial [Thermoanaerobaculia bacterium]|nr:tail fiber domain-containing protein [Thermoanaerobaculia bacterium]
LVQSGTFTVRNGAIVSPEATEEGSGPRQRTGKQIITAETQVIPEDLVVQGSECVGFDCTATESFGFDTIRLKENNLRIKFEDTSTGAYPSNDWQLLANDSASGGANKFTIEDVTGATVPFTITAAAPNNSVFVASTGKVGFRTSTPVLDLHATTGNTPALRLEQDTSGGFTAQTWDIGANEANFFVRDVTGGSRLSFRIRPGAPTSSIDIASSGNVGIGTASPSEELHVSGSDGDTKLLVQESSATTAAREIGELRNKGGVVLIFEDTSVAQRWSNGTTGSSFAIDEQANTGTEFLLTNTGNLTISGALTQGSDRDSKTDIVAVSPEEVLTRLSSLPIATWRYKGDDPNARHLGPMAQDFAALFGLGNDNRRIAPLDVAGVSLAAVQALHKQVDEKDAAISALRQQNDELAQRLARLEALVSSLASAAK